MSKGRFVRADAPRRPTSVNAVQATAQQRDMVDRAIAAGRIPESTRDSWLASFVRRGTGPAAAQLINDFPPGRFRRPAAAATGSVTPRASGGGARWAAAPAPVFAQGARPAVMASGLDPSIVDSVPWHARRAVARAATAQEVHALVDRYGGAAGEQLAVLDSFQGGPLSVDVAEIETAGGVTNPVAAGSWNGAAYKRAVAEAEKAIGR